MTAASPDSAPASGADAPLAGVLPLRWSMLLGFLAGALLPLALAPFHLAPLGVLSFTLVLAALWGRTVREALLVGWIVGLGRYGVGVSWIYVSIHEHGGASVLLAGAMVALFVAFMAVFPALFAAGFAALRPRTLLVAVAAFTATQLGLEWILTWFMTGFPWLLAGYTQMDWPLAGWAPVLGVLGVSLLTVASGCVLWALWATRGAGRGIRALAVGVLLAWLAGAGLARIEWSDPDGAPLDVALVQGAVAQATKWRPESRQLITDRYLELSAPHADADLLLWPEAALTIYARDNAPFLDRLGATLAGRDATLVLGLPDYDIDPAAPRRAVLRNTAIALGAGDGRYVKQRLVPFGEYVPLEGLLRGLIEFFDMPMSRARPGPAGQAPLRIGSADGSAGIGMSMAICYEVAYGELVRELSAEAGLLSTISNDTWFGDSIGPSQHLQMARMRAVELARPMLRSTNDGITALIDHHGRVIDRLPRFEPGVLRGVAQPRTGATPYARLGSWPTLLLVLALLAGVLAARRR